MKPGGRLQGGWRRRRRIDRGLLVASALVSQLSAVPAHADRVGALKCKPTVQYVCDTANCQQLKEGFQHAESFAFDDADETLSACLWTRCYAGRGRVFRHAAAGGMTIFAELMAEGVPDASEPILLSLSLDRNDDFVAVWQYSGQGLSFDQGRCRR